MDFLRTTAVMLIGLFFTPTASADIIYGVTGAGGNPSSLYTINGSNGQATLVSAVTYMGNSISLAGISYNPVNGLIYGATNSNSPSNPNNLFTIDPLTGYASRVGAFGGPNFQSLGFTSSGTLYGYAKNPSPEGLYTINVASASPTRVGASGSSLGTLLGPTGSSGNGLAVSSSGNIYLAPGGASGGGSQPHAKLFTLDVSTGAYTEGPAFQNSPLLNSNMKAMAFDSTGTMYGLVFTPGGSFTTHFVSVDLTNGIISDIGSTQNGMVGLAFVPTAVPEPNALSLTMCPIILCLIGLWMRRRETANRAAD